MGMGWRHKIFGKIRRQDLFNLYLLIGGVSIVVATTIFTINMSKSVEKQSFLATQLISGIASLLLENRPLEEVRPVVSMINSIEVPIILTNNEGRPILWNEPVIGIALPEYQVLFQENMSKPSHPIILEILSLAAAYDMDQQPFAIFNQEGKRVGTLHYGRSALSQRLRIMPYLELAVMALFFLVILWALQNKKDAQAKALFAGMAKETAHQLGTPLTSIMGWMALLEERLDKDDDLIVELNRDVGRLSMISARFSQIGSLPKLNDSDLVGVVDETIIYFRNRLPHLGGRVELRREGDSINPVVFNRDLLGWVLENLIKNGIDALIEGKGTITIMLKDIPGGGVEMRIADTGKGIPAREGNKVFEPGFTTKKRGWGMGLALVKRIATQYHNGKIRIESTNQHGTTFLVTLPAAPEPPQS